MANKVNKQLEKALQEMAEREAKEQPEPISVNPESLTIDAVLDEFVQKHREYIEKTKDINIGRY